VAYELLNFQYTQITLDFNNALLENEANFVALG
jgi:hypothetical protein